MTERRERGTDKSAPQTGLPEVRSWLAEVKDNSMRAVMVHQKTVVDFTILHPICLFPVVTILTTCPAWLRSDTRHEKRYLKCAFEHKRHHAL